MTEEEWRIVAKANPGQAIYPCYNPNRRSAPWKPSKESLRGIKPRQRRHGRPLWTPPTVRREESDNSTRRKTLPGVW